MDIVFYMTNIALVHMDGPQKLNTDGEMIASSCMDSAGIECSKPAPTAELNALAQREVRRNAVINAKLRDRLKTFLHLDTGMRVTAILRAICIGALCIAFSNFLFLYRQRPAITKSGLQFRQLHCPHLLSWRRLPG